jgi:hypothetical protein
MFPDDVVIMPELPNAATGKLMNTRLREVFRDHAAPVYRPVDPGPSASQESRSAAEKLRTAALAPQDVPEF